jgi:hypothetical protein
MAARDRNYEPLLIPRRVFAPFAFGGNPHVVDQVRARPSSMFCSALRRCLLRASKLLRHVFSLLTRVRAPRGCRVDFAMLLGLNIPVVNAQTARLGLTAPP